LTSFNVIAGASTLTGPGDVVDKRFVQHLCTGLVTAFGISFAALFVDALSAIVRSPFVATFDATAGATLFASPGKALHDRYVKRPLSRNRCYLR